MKIKPIGPASEMVPDVPEHCSRCGVELRGCAVDHPDGWLCAIDCGRPRYVVVPPIPRTGDAEVDAAIEDFVNFRDTGLDAPR